MHKEIDTKLGMIILVIIAFLVGIITLEYAKEDELGKKQSPNVPVQPKNSEKNQQFSEIDEQELERIAELTKDWQTYRNEEYGYEFKYPQDYSIEKNKDEKDIDEVSIVSRGDCLLPFGDKCNITIRTISADDPREKACEKFEKAKRFSINEKNITYCLSDGLSAVIQTKKKNYLMVSLPYPEKIIPIFKGIYSTFKEINDTQELTKDWQTYRNEEYGYEFKYPQDYHITANPKETKGEKITKIESNEKYYGLDGGCPNPPCEASKIPNEIVIGVRKTTIAEVKKTLRVTNGIDPQEKT